ncbi:MAG TPA: hypothetical protein PLT00_13100 [Verrucomicrobiota bacterium]|nr:hypothetical protein [Verrucomicrobiota bacterium]HQB17639.1 hypothetical protein [Verrucomicrobiota bacterium]
MRTGRHGLHQKLVARTRANGIKAAAREFGGARSPVRKWLRRYQPGKPPAPAAAQRLPWLFWPPAALAYEWRAPPRRASACLGAHGQTGSLRA